jgi:hypothetical protein
VLCLCVKFGRKPVPGCERFVRTSPQSLSPLCALLAGNFSSSTPRVFKDLRTLPFLGSQVSLVLSRGCALFRWKPGVLPTVLPIARRNFSAAGLAYPPQLLWRRALTPFSATLTENRGERVLACTECGRRVIPILFSVGCRLSTVGFPFRRALPPILLLATVDSPFPVITGENQ